ncbi:MAG: bifunctional 3-demethylubiquinol 3-O-methyltransferase/2-polyprenyl-6-hydroxyphenol methylase [Gammaproteobacteria bacterium]|nr:MAG: bifunctional 3-demethylubiquinol 3-O-methyltransferase/2-polyprenyl-6-hydroxyphenol methylase [Gammaproteobacteria bacterium]
MTTHTEQEIAKFDALAADFWNRDGEFKTLHQINPIRLKFIAELMPLSGKHVADIGCGGGILAEALDERGARVTAIDLSEVGIQTAKAHQQQSGSQVDYRVQSTADFAAELASHSLLDGVFCMEMLEHVKNPESIIADCARMLKPGGLAVFSTINRTKKAHLLAVIVAEYIIRMVPQGTHDPKLFIKPSQMQRMAAKAGLQAVDIIGFEYRPFSNDFVRSHNTDINYIFAFRKISTPQKQ